VRAVIGSLQSKKFNIKVYVDKVAVKQMNIKILSARRGRP